MDFKNLSDIDTLAEVSDNTKLIGLENGKAVQVPADGLKHEDNVFIIDTTADEYSTSDTAYGDKVKAALLAGKAVWIYLDNYNYGSSAYVSNVYLLVSNFRIVPATDGLTVKLYLYAWSYWIGSFALDTLTCSIGE